MKLRTQIFLITFALGILPILTLVAVNLSEHIQRHEESGRKQIHIRLKLKTSNLEAEINQRIKLLDIITGLKEIDRLIISKWLLNDRAISRLIVKDESNNQVLHLVKSNGDFVAGSAGSEKKAGDFVIRYPKQSSEILYTSSLFLDPDILLDNYVNSFWINSDGKYLNQPTEATNLLKTGDNAFHDFQDLELLLNSFKPSVWENGEGIIVGWIPLYLNSESPSFWIGTPVDRTAALKWKRSLIKNIILIILTLSAVIFIIASAIAKKVDAIKAQIIDGLDRVLNYNEEFRFSWTGPKEITNMAEDLSKMAQQYLKNLHAREEAEYALNENRENFLNLTNSAQDAIIFMDPDGNISFWNLAAKDIFGYSKEEAEGKAIHNLISPRLPDDHMDSTEQFSDKGGPIRETIELITVKKDGTEIPIELSLSEARIKDRWHSIWIIRDISERKSADEKAILHQQQLIQADKMASLGLLISGVAHEINNPNSISLLNTTMLAKSWKSVSPILEEYYKETGDFLVAGLEYSEMRDQVPRLFHELEESSKRIKSIVKDLKDYARQDSTSLMDQVDLNKICNTAVRLTGNLLKKSTEKFSLTLSEKTPPVKGNSQRLEQVVINLLQNSCDSLDSMDQSISLETGSGYNNAFIRVTDEGCGIPDDLLNRLTDPFFTTKRNIGGTGLGLSVSAGIIKEHNAIMDFRSKLGEGTTVTITFPSTERSNL